MTEYELADKVTEMFQRDKVQPGKAAQALVLVMASMTAVHSRSFDELIEGIGLHQTAILSTAMQAWIKLKQAKNG